MKKKKKTLCDIDLEELEEFLSDVLKKYGVELCLRLEAFDSCDLIWCYVTKRAASYDDVLRLPLQSNGDIDPQSCPDTFAKLWNDLPKIKRKWKKFLLRKGVLADDAKVRVKLGDLRQMNDLIDFSFVLNDSLQSMLIWQNIDLKKLGDLSDKFSEQLADFYNDNSIVKLLDEGRRQS